ncbi:MAG: hypothetical protein CEN91_320 [Candidatus Berkelbacteria bacterium Licking1014_85]|uniref:Radical SAM protein n=1 Tax=Candidatus Berkelbacteria bacterium Licking1014_85 TaxID=2017148 RepID=A0A554LJF1_9BACT|nr:MAG: hypothetical protein CEN91_320 [Candidatus Berkelbacteria bacterium Licking1014_85]
MTISVEGVSPEMHDLTTQAQESYNQTIQGIVNCVKRGLRVDSATTLSVANYNYANDFVDLMANLSIEEVGFNIVTPNPCDSVENQQNSVELLPQMIGALHNIVEYSDKTRVKIHFATSIPLCLALLNAQLDVHFRGNCFVFDGSGVVIDYNGKIIPCVHWVGAYIDSIYQENGQPKTRKEFYKNWNNGFPLSFRQEIAKFPAEKCQHCDYWEKGACKGGCPLLRLNQDLSTLIMKGLNFLKCQFLFYTTNNSSSKIYFGKSKVSCGFPNMD